MKILAIDPGTEQSAWCVFETCGTKDHPITFGQDPNETFVKAWSPAVGHVRPWPWTGEVPDLLVIEQIKSYGNVMGDCVLQTCVWIGRFIQAWNGPFELIPRKRIVTHLCMNPRANDSNVRQALIDRWGGKEKAIGSKSKPGILYGVRNDMWSALAVAVAWSELDKLFQDKLN